MGLVWITGLLTATGCSKTTAPLPAQQGVGVAQGIADIWCTNWPLYALTRELAGSELRVSWLEPPGGFTAAGRRSWFPADEQLAGLQAAKLVIDNGPGAPYAWWTGMTALGERKLCHATVDFALADYIPVRAMQITHSHGPEGEHSHDYLVPFVWHDPALVRKLVRTIAERLVKEWPDHAEEFQTRAAEMSRELAGLEEELKEAGQRLKERGTVVLATPDLLFAARGLGLGDVQTELWLEEADQAGWSTRLDALQLSDEDVTTVLFPGPVPDLARAAAEGRSGLALVAIDMLEQGGSNETVVGRLKELARSLGQEEEGVDGR